MLLSLLAVPLSAQRTLLHCGRLINGISDQPRQKVTLIVEGKRITDIEDGYTRGERGDQTIDLKDQTVMPGFMDMHVHLEWESSPRTYLNRYQQNPADIAFQAAVYARTTLMAGFTTVRDLGGTGVNIALAKAIREGLTEGPRIYTAGKAIATTGGHADPTSGYRQDLMGDPGPREGVINGPDEAAQAVRQRYKNGADLIKITATGGVLSVAKDGAGPQFTDEEVAAIVAIANDYGMTTAAHAHGAEGMERAVRAGITSIEHGTLMTPEIMALMVEKGTYYVPTLTAGKAVATNARIPGYYPAIIVPKALAIGPQIEKTYAQAYAAGVRIAFGTDAGVFPHGENAREFVYMVEGGMPPMEAIQSATRVAAELLRIDDEVGTLQAGLLADIVATPGDPLEDISTLQHITFVMKDGMIYKSSAK